MNISTIRRNYDAGAQIFRRESVRVLLERIDALEHDLRCVPTALRLSEEEYREELRLINEAEIRQAVESTG